MVFRLPPRVRSLVLLGHQLREKPAPLAPLQTEISETVEPQEEEIPLQVIEHTVLRDWKPNSDYRGLGLEILVGEKSTEEELVTLIKKLAARREHVNIRVYSSKRLIAKSNAKPMATHTNVAISCFISRTHRARTLCWIKRNQVDAGEGSSPP